MRNVEYIFGRPWVDRQHIIFISSSHTTKIHSVVPNFWFHSLFPRFRGSTQLRGSSWPGSIISSHLPTLLGLKVEGTRPELFAASHCIAILMQACTQ